MPWPISNAWRLAAGGVVLAGAAFGVSNAHAQSNKCAIYGSGYVAMQGSDTCVRIGGRVRVDAGIVQRGNIYAPTPDFEFAPVAPGAVNSVEREHLRVPGGSQNGMPRTR
ncbi:MAG: porin [Beijerinckiaceae bacterium]|nr:porin [Beijerinckiaceae bacterium]